MRRFLLLLFAAVVTFSVSGCAKPERLSVQAEYRRRQERRQREAARRRQDRITSLSGLNSVELDELERSKRENDLNPNPGSFVYSPKGRDPHGTDRITKELNDDGQKNVKQYRDNVLQKNKSGRNWVYGI